MRSAKTALIDSSSAIILFKSGMFERVSDFYRVVMPPSVFTELTGADHTGSVEFRRSLDDGRISIMTNDDTADYAHGDMTLKGLDRGERDTIRLFQTGAGDIVILDDRKAASYCKSNAIPYINALLMPRILLLAGRISHEECDESMQRIAEHGWYSRWVIEFARHCDDERLAAFI